MRPLPLAFTEHDSREHFDVWGFNCGPGALCAILGLHPSQVRGKIPHFEERHYTNPTMMVGALRALGIQFEWTKDGGRPVGFPVFGLARIQWDGPWIGEGVPFVARYRHSHWVATAHIDGMANLDLVAGRGVFDINCSHWISLDDWKETLVPLILQRCEPNANGNWWVTDSIEIRSTQL